MVRHLQYSSFIDEVVIATTTARDDEQICELALQEGVRFYKGSEDDVLARVVECHEMCGSDIIVELTGDCPMIDTYWVDRCIEKYLSEQWDFVSNCIPMTFPRGFDCKVFRFSDLKWMAENVHDEAVREHVSLYFYEEEGRYTVGTIEAPMWLRFPKYRLTLDTEDDFKLITTIFEKLYPSKHYFGTKDIMGFLQEHPEFLEINKQVNQKKIRG